MIALVDDNEAALETIALLLGRAGIGDVRLYIDPIRLLGDMRSGMQPEMIITDFIMFGMNGPELLDKIARTYGNIPGVIMTAYPEAVQPAWKGSSRRYRVYCKADPDFFHNLAREIAAVRNLRDGSDNATDFAGDRSHRHQGDRAGLEGEPVRRVEGRKSEVGSRCSALGVPFILRRYRQDRMPY